MAWCKEYVSTYIANLLCCVVQLLFRVNAHHSTSTVLDEYLTIEAPTIQDFVFSLIATRGVKQLGSCSGQIFIDVYISAFKFLLGSKHCISVSVSGKLYQQGSRWLSSGFLSHTMGTINAVYVQILILVYKIKRDISWILVFSFGNAKNSQGVSTRILFKLISAVVKVVDFFV